MKGRIRIVDVILILIILVLFALLIVCNSCDFDCRCTQACAERGWNVKRTDSDSEMCVCSETPCEPMYICEEVVEVESGCSDAVTGIFVVFLVFLALSIPLWLIRLFRTERD